MIMYRVCQCPYCGRVQLSTATKTFRCISCGKTRGFSTRMGVPVIKQFGDGRQASAFISEYKRLKQL